jgi:hypothetical protein
MFGVAFSNNLPPPPGAHTPGARKSRVAAVGMTMRGGGLYVGPEGPTLKSARSRRAVALKRSPYNVEWATAAA